MCSYGVSLVNRNETKNATDMDTFDRIGVEFRCNSHELGY